MSKPRIAVFSGPCTTIANTQPLVTGNKAHEKYGLEPMLEPDNSPPRFDVLRPQRLATRATVYVEQFSAHPLERDASELYAPPDRYVNDQGFFHESWQGPNDVSVYAIDLFPEDGLYPLPYMARQANGLPWNGDAAYPSAPAELARQPFYPDASRMFEEIDRLGIGNVGTGNLLSSKAEFDFYRPAPAGGYTKGLPSDQRTDVGQGDVPPERRGQDFFYCRPFNLRADAPLATLAKLTNMVQEVLASGTVDGGMWLEGSPMLEDTLYWLNLLVDTTVPITGIAGQRPHGAIGNDGDHNIVDALDYIVSGVWAGSDGHDRIGAVAVEDQHIFTARTVHKADARPGGYVATGGHGGIIGSVGHGGPAVITFYPAQRHTHTSKVNLTRLPQMASGVQSTDGRIESIEVQIKDEAGALLPKSIPFVSIVKAGYYHDRPVASGLSVEVEVAARIERNLIEAPLAGFVGEGWVPYGRVTASIDQALRSAPLRGMPSVMVGRGDTEGFTQPMDLLIGGGNLTATKARMLLMACLLRLGSLPPATMPDQPTSGELAAIRAKIIEYQHIFDTH